MRLSTMSGSDDGWMERKSHWEFTLPSPIVFEFVHISQGSKGVYIFSSHNITANYSSYQLLCVLPSLQPIISLSLLYPTRLECG